MSITPSQKHRAEAESQLLDEDAIVVLRARIEELEAREDQTAKLEAEIASLKADLAAAEAAPAADPPAPRRLRNPWNPFSWD